MLLDAGFLATRVALARFDPGECLLVDRGAPALEQRDVSGCGGRLAGRSAGCAAGVKPERLPERLQYKVRATTPQPSVTLTRTVREYADGYRDTLGAVLRFDYAGTSVEPGGGVGVYDAVNRRLIRRGSRRRAEGVPSPAAARIPARLGLFEQQDDARHSSRSVPARRARARDRRMAGRGGRKVVPLGSRHADARVVRHRLVRAARRDRFRRGRPRNAARLLAALRQGERDRHCSTTARRGLVPEEWLQQLGGDRAHGRGGGRSRPLQAVAGRRCSTRRSRRSPRSRSTKRSPARATS